ncbi:ATP-dependent DNA helicase [Trichinella spiralis]|uniref:ATP-dependent DNA helicase n=1 Tax=Trichinella spiralis TaxID=6334 RepID=A0ABR3KI82_TRISP
MRGGNSVLIWSMILIDANPISASPTHSSSGAAERKIIVFKRNNVATPSLSRGVNVAARQTERLRCAAAGVQSSTPNIRPPGPHFRRHLVTGLIHCITVRPTPR